MVPGGEEDRMDYRAPKEIQVNQDHQDRKVKWDHPDQREQEVLQVHLVHLDLLGKTESQDFQGKEVPQ